MPKVRAAAAKQRKPVVPNKRELKEGNRARISPRSLCNSFKRCYKLSLRVAVPPEERSAKPVRTICEEGRENSPFFHFFDGFNTAGGASEAKNLKTKMSQPDADFETLSSLLQLTCAKCGEGNSLRATECRRCGARLEQHQQDPESLSYLHAEGLEGLIRAHATSHKLKRLQLALAGVREGTLSLADYKQVVGQVLAETSAMREIINLQALRSLESKFPPEAVDVLRETSDNIDAFFRACERMGAFDGTDFAAAEDGYTMAEAALEDMEATQREAAELEAGYREKSED